MQPKRKWLIRWASGAFATVSAVDYFEARDRAQQIAPSLRPWAIVLQA